LNSEGKTLVETVTVLIVAMALFA